VTKWKPPGAFANVTSAHLDEVMRRLELADSRKDPRAATYVGYLIAEVVALDMEYPLHTWRPWLRIAERHMRDSRRKRHHHA
jgi:hypothetical protein